MTTLPYHLQITDLDVGDTVYAAHDIVDDGSMPEGCEGQLLASAGTRGVITMIGHLEENPNQTVFLVRFEDAQLNLGNPIGCWTDDLSATPLTS